MNTTSAPISTKEDTLAITPLILIAGSMTIVCVVDILLPTGVAVPILYVIPILVAVGCTALTLLGYPLSTPGVPAWIALSNRALAVTAIWTTAVLAWRHLQATEHISALQDLLPICASCKKIRDDKGYWSQVEHYIEAHTKTIFSHGICPECMLKWYPEFYPQVVEQYPDLFKSVSSEIVDERLPHGKGHP
jgi:hypothetical protein